MDFLTFSKKAAAYAAEQHISDYELYYQADKTSQVSVLGETVDRLASSSVEGVSLRVIVNGRTGVSSTESFTGEEIPELFKRALEAAEVAEEGVQQDIYAGGSYRELPAAAMPENDAAAEQAALLKAEGYACAADPRVQKGLMASMADVSSKTAISNSRGLYLESSGAMTVASMNVVAADESGKKYNDHASAAKACGADQDIKALAERAVEKTVAQIGASPVKSGQYPVIFDASQMAAMLEIFQSAFSAQQAQNGMSVLAGKAGEKVASDLVTIVDDPFYPENFFQSAFDAEGVPTATRNVVENGTLTTLLHNRATAAKEGVESTGNAFRASYASPVAIAPHTFYLKPSDMNREELLGKAGTAVMITFMKGAHAGANAVSGDFSLESKGFLVEDGKIVRAVEEITVAGNFFQMLKDITAVANDLKVNVEDGASCCGAPTVLVSGLAIAGA